MAEDDVTKREANDDDVITRKVPDGGWGWMVVLGAMTIHFIHTGIEVSFGVFYPILVERFRTTATQTSLVVSLYNLFRMFMAPVASALVLRYGCRPVALVGGVLLTVGCAASAYITTVYAMYVSLGIIAGFGACLSFVPTYITVNQYFDKKKGRAMSLATLGNSLAPLLFATIVTFLVQIYSYSGAMLVMAGLAFNTLPACALYRPLPEPKYTLTSVIEKNTEAQNDKKDIIETHNKTLGNTEIKLLDGSKETVYIGKSTESVKIHRASSRKCPRMSCLFDCLKQFRYMADVKFFIYGLTTGAMTTNMGCIFAFLPALCISKGLSQSDIVLMFILCGTCDCIGRFVAGALYDFRVIKPHRVLLQGIIGVLMGISTIAIPLMMSAWSVILMVCIRAVLLGAINGQRMTILSDIVGEHKMGACVGLVLWFQGIGSSVGVLLAGVIKDQFRTFLAVYLYAGGVMLVVCGIFILYYKLSPLCVQQPAGQNSTKINKFDHKQTTL